MHMLPLVRFLAFHHKLGTLVRTHSTSTAEEIASKAVTIVMPQLSPSMTSGSISKWLKKPSERFSNYEVIMEITTESLSEEAYRVGDLAGTVTMLVEAQEDGVVHDILVPEGKEVAVGTPVAVMCEYEEDLKALEGAKAQLKDLLKTPDKLRSLTWQSYLKSSSGENSGSCG